MNGDATAVERWLAVQDELLRGISHALSNRIATIGASHYLLEHGDAPVQQIVVSQRAEVDRMEVLLQQLRLLPGRPGADAEPITVSDACTGAIALHALHGELRDIAVEIDADPAVYPVWVEPQSFCHALLMALTIGKRNSVKGSSVQLHIAGDADVVRFRIVPEPATPHNAVLDTADAAAAGWLLAASGGTARTVNNGCELEVPTLMAARRARKG